MHRCGLYTRVSTDLQAQVKEGSLDTQIDLLQRYVELKDRSTDQDWIVAETYREEGKSGKNTARPEFQRMLQDIQEQNINTVVCTKIDRVSRSLIDLLEFHKFLENLGVTFISLNESWDTSTPMGKFALTITAAAAQLEREQTSERTREKMQWRAEQGLSCGQILGYDIDPENPGIPLPNAKEKAMLLFMYETYVQEKALRPVARIMNAKGYRTKFYTSRRGKVQGGKKFAKTTVQRLLTSPFYIGKVVHKGKLYDGKHEPIIPVDLWERVQRILVANHEGGVKPRKQNVYTFLLQGLVRCGKCGGGMTPTFGYNHQSRAYPYYACNQQLKLGKEECDMRPVPATALEEVVAKRLQQLNSDPSLVSALVSNTSYAASQRLQELTEAKQIHGQNITGVQKKIDTLVESMAEGGVSIKSVSQKLVDLEEQKEQLEAGLREIEADMAETRKKVVHAERFKGTLTTFSEMYTEANPTERKELMQLHIHQLDWTPNRIRMAIYETPTEPLPRVNHESKGSMDGYNWLP